MTFMGKILVLLNLMMSVIFMAFAVVVYDTRVKLNEDLDKQKKIVNDVRREKAVAEEEKLVLDKNLKDTTEQLKKVQLAAEETAKSFKRRNEELVADLSKTRTESSKGLTELGNATVEQKQRREEVETLRKTAEGLRAKNNELTAKNSELGDKLAEKTNDLQVMTSRNEQMAERLKQLEGYVVRKVGAVPDEGDLRSGQDVPPPPSDVEGIVKKVDKTGKWAVISVGEDDGFRAGQKLEVWRTHPSPKYIGVVRIDTIEATTAVVKPLSLYGGPILENDHVGAKILHQSN